MSGRAVKENKVTVLVFHEWRAEKETRVKHGRVWCFLEWTAKIGLFGLGHGQMNCPT